MRAKNTAVVHLFRQNDAVLSLKIFGERVTDSHMERPVHLPLELDRIEDSADVVGSDHFYQLAIIIEDRKLGGESVAEVRFGPSRFIEVVAELRRVRAAPFADKRLANEICQR